MASLVTIPELAAWLAVSGVTLTEADHPKAQVVLDAASLVVRDTASQPTWTDLTAPDRAKLITVQLAKRTYLNPDAVTSENVGPMGERRVEDFARTLELTAAETAELVKLAPADVLASQAGGLWIQPMANRPNAPDSTVYVTDSGGSDWMIPYLHPDDAWAMTPL